MTDKHYMNKPFDLVFDSLFSVST